MLIYIGVLIELTTVIFGFLNYHKFKNTIYTKFIYFLLYVVLNEILGYIFAVYLKIPNYLLFNIYDLITILFYLYFYKAFIQNVKIKMLINFFGILAICSYIIEIFVLNMDIITKNASYAPHIGSVMILMVLILFLFEIINNEKIVFNLSKSMIFWISIGLLLYVVGTIPIFISREIMNYNVTYQYILFALNVIMYGSFVTGFIYSKKEYNYLNNE